MFWINQLKNNYICFLYSSFDSSKRNPYNVTWQSETPELRQIDITEVTCREADQSPGTSMNRYEKALVALWLKKAWIPIIEIGFPANPVDYDNTNFIMQQMGDGKNDTDPVLSVLWRAEASDTERSLEILDGYDKPRIHIFIATSEKHLKAKFKKWPRKEYSQEQLEQYVLDKTQESLDLALDHKRKNPNLEIEISLEDGSNTRPEFVRRFIQQFDVPEVTCINIPDTMWVLNAHGTESIFQMCSAIVQHVKLSTHNHNDRWYADANSIVAAQNGADYIETTLLWAGEGPWNADTTTIINNINKGDQYDKDGKKMILSKDLVAQEVWYVSWMFESIVTFNKTDQLPFVWKFAFEDAAWVHTAAEEAYRAGLDSEQYWHVKREEFFSARWWETQMLRMMQKHWIKIQKNEKWTESPEANYWIRRCIKTSEREKFVFSRDMLAMYLEAQWVLSIWPIELNNKEVSFGFTYKWQEYKINWVGWEDQWFIHGLTNWIADFLWTTTNFQLVWVDPRNKTPLRQSANQYLEVSQRTNELSQEYKDQVMSIVEMDEKNHLTTPVRDLIDELILDWKKVSSLEKIIDNVVEWKIPNDIEEKFASELQKITWSEVTKNNKILIAFRNSVKDIKKYNESEHWKSKWWSQLWVCTSTVNINWETVHSTVSDTNLDHASLISIFRTFLPEVIKKIDSNSEGI